MDVIVHWPPVSIPFYSTLPGPTPSQLMRYTYIRFNRSPTIPDEYLTQDLSWNNPELRPNEDTRPPRGLPALQLPRPMQQPPIQAPLPQPAQAFPQPSNFPSSSRGQPTNWNADRSLERRPQAPSSNATFTPSVWSPKPMNARPAFQPIPSLPSSPPPNVVDQISPSLRSPARLSNIPHHQKAQGNDLEKPLELPTTPTRTPSPKPPRFFPNVIIPLGPTIRVR
ncbi:hypothetical protein BC829DRAFT_57913 [Chytridium lagenaria]|nr:hypothetical protein BC829DRAFT_57913 [Chytridium lagenaria]